MSSRLVSVEDAGVFLCELDDSHFQDLDGLPEIVFPEIAELRALRFGELD